MSPCNQDAVIASGSLSTILTSFSGTPASSRAARRLKCAVDAKGVAIVLPFRSAIDLIPESPFTINASAVPMTSKIQGTWYSIPVEIPRDVGLLPTRPKSTLPATTASFTDPPESNRLHSTLTPSPRAVSSSFWFFTTRRPPGTFW